MHRYFKIIKSQWTAAEQVIIRLRLRKTMVELCDQLQALLQAGLPLDSAIKHLKEGSPARFKQTILHSTQLSLDIGKPLSMAWEPFISAMFCRVLQSGEQSGRLADVLMQYVHHSKEQQEWQNQLLRIITYPALLAAMTLLLLVFVSHVVLPTFNNMYAELGYQVAASTKNIEKTLLVLPNVTFVALLLAAFVTCITVVLAQKNPIVRKVIWRWLPGMSFVRLSRTRVLTGQLNLLVGSGMPLVHALQTLCSSKRPVWLVRTAENIIEQILAGLNLHRAFAGEWESVFFVLLQTAEKTGDLVSVFERTEAYAKQQLKKSMNRLAHIVEPCLLAGMGCIVALTMYVVFIPMYDFITVISTGKQV